MKRTVCVDLDGVLAHYDGWKGIEHIGAPIEGALLFMQQLAHTYRVVVLTTRCKEYLNSSTSPAGTTDPDRRPADQLAAIVRRWLDEHGFPYDEIYVGQGKPFAIAYIDDRAVACAPQDSDDADFWFKTALAKVRKLDGKFKPAEVAAVLQAVPLLQAPPLTTAVEVSIVDVPPVVPVVETAPVLEAIPMLEAVPVLETAPVLEAVPVPESPP